MIRVFEAFAGYGSQSLALERLNIPHEVVCISEIDKYAIQAYETLHSKVNNLGDISKISVRTIPDHDLFTYSFPCQDISVAGNQKGLIEGQTRSGLLWECERIIEAKRPKYLLMENVKNLISKKFMPDFLKWKNKLEQLGYTNYCQVLNAKDYGIPQNRERVFMISILGEHKPYVFPKGFDNGLRLKDMLDDEVDEKYYISQEKVKKVISQLNTMSELQEFEEDHMGMVFKDKQGLLLSKQATVIDKQIDIANTLLARDYKGFGNQAMNAIVIPYLTPDKGVLVREATKKGYAVAEVGDSINLEQPNSKTRRGRVGKGVAQTLTCSCNQATLIDYSIRKLTPRECFRLMGLHDDEIDKIQQVGISNSQQYKLAGNSIVVDVLEYIFASLFDVNFKIPQGL